MRLFSKKISVRTSRELEMVDISAEARGAVEESRLRNGIVSLFVQGSTAALTTIEFEPGLQKDFPRFLERVVPSNIPYEHHLTWNDGNGHSHIRASLLKPDLTVHFENGRLVTGAWQQIVLINLDTRGRERSVFFRVIGE